MDPRGVDDASRADGAGRISADPHLKSKILRVDCLDGAAACQPGTPALGVSQERSHEGVAVDDAGARGVERGYATNVGLESSDLFCRQQLQVLDAVGASQRMSGFQRSATRFLHCDDQLAGERAGDSMGVAPLQEESTPPHA